MSGELSDQDEPIEGTDDIIEPTTPVRAWTKIVLISVGIVIVGGALLIVLWLLFSLTMGLISEVL